MEIGFAYALAGLVVGFAVGLTGVGGGALMTPLLHLGFGIPIATAVGTDLLYAAVTKVSGIYAHGRAHSIRWDIAGLLALGSLPAAALTVFAIRWFDLDSEQFEQLIIHTLSFAVLATATLLLLKSRLLSLLQRLPTPGCLSHAWCRKGITVAGGVVIGVLVTLSSVGAGVLGTTFILLLYPRLSAVGVVGTELAHAVPLTLVAGLGHLGLGSVDLGLLMSLLVGSVPGAYLGARVGTRLTDGVLRPVLACMLMYIGIRLGFF